ncbi:hypothetical protein EJ04DRAFT_1758 [Polyplosphaeria fusca]|uniref:Uncharacterized protein n=1 Tax=Polyplosphaeria fusca TaxID=682080 RepID=A0A9P4RDQ6_9PLEO|nr:hypothetical protein EJ04DRAFT_1758 [Polyplosphaeria fusca]
MSGEEQAQPGCCVLPPPLEICLVWCWDWVYGTAEPLLFMGAGMSFHTSIFFGILSRIVILVADARGFVHVLSMYERRRGLGSKDVGNECGEYTYT